MPLSPLRGAAAATALIGMPAMPRLSMLPTVVREVFARTPLPREPEPEVMDEAGQVAAFAAAGELPGAVAAAHVFHAARISQVIQGCTQVVDLGCGPAVQMARVAELNPGVRFLGIDLSQEMLALARQRAAGRGLANVDFAVGDITRLDGVPDDSADAVISTMTLHHLPTPAALHACLQAVDRVLRPGGALYLVDFNRLGSARSVRYIAWMDPHLPEAFCRDYECSLRAAFSRSEFAAAAAALPAGVEVITTRPLPVLIVLKTADRPLPDAVRERLCDLRRNLPRAVRRDLDDIRQLFRLGGLKADPFGRT